MSRTAPKSVVKALKRYDASLGVRFNDRRRRWTLTRKGEDTTVTWSQRDLNPSAALERVARCDSHRAPSTRAFVKGLGEACDRPAREKAKDFNRYQRDMKADIRQRLRAPSQISFAGVDSPLFKPKKLNILQGGFVK